MLPRSILSLLVAMVPAGWAAETREEVSVPMTVRPTWARLAPGAPEGGCCGATSSALRTLRAIDPKTGRPYEERRDLLGCDPAQLRRCFRLEKGEYILGEPIAVEFRIELHGPGTFAEPVGGNYRARGRDDNFLFLMRHADGTWVPDPYAPIEMYMGGISTEFKVTKGKPFSYWHPVQRWCAIERPGTYELFCFQAAHEHGVAGIRQAVLASLPERVKSGHSVSEDGHLVDAASGKPSTLFNVSTSWTWESGEDSPLVKEIPVEVLEQMKDWSRQAVADCARCTITIREPGEAERAEMVKRWTQVASDETERSWPTGRAEAARQAISFARQDEFLPLLASWLKGADPNPYIAQGLAMRSSARAFEILMGEPNQTSIGALHYLRPERIPDAIPAMIDLLTSPTNQIRAQAESYLTRWSGKSFGRTWQGYLCDRPTLEEGRAMQAEWRRWWQEGRSDFKPVERR